MADNKRGKAAFFSDDDFSVTEEQVVAPATETAPAPAPAGSLGAFAEPTRTQGRKGQKAPRMNLAIPEDVYDFVRRQSRKEGLTYSEFFCALARQYQKELGE